MYISMIDALLALVELALLRGPRFVQQIMDAKDKKEWTADEIRALKIYKTPEEYFDK